MGFRFILTHIYTRRNVQQISNGVNFEIQYITYLFYSATVLRFLYLIRWFYIDCKYYWHSWVYVLFFTNLFHILNFIFNKWTHFFLFFQLDKGENEDGVYQASGSANIILYVGLGMISIGLVITFVGLGDKGFRTLELKLIGPSLVGCGVFFALLRVLFCTVPSCCRACCKCCRKTEDTEELIYATVSITL